jgi:glycosyltransferase involved in cell wall biosynthesis
MDHVVGMMWNKDEADILPEIIHEALKRVDTLVIADDGSTDNSWNIIQSFAVAHPEIEHLRQEPNKNDKGQRQALLDEIRRRYKPETTLVQLIESDIMILDTDIKQAWANRSDNVKMKWVALNAVRQGAGPWSWQGEDTYPYWPRPIKEIMPFAHYMEEMTYTFRPFPELSYDQKRWRPWPNGFSKVSPDEQKMSEHTPLLAHYGYRGPTHVWEKYAKAGLRHPRYKEWNFATPQTTAETVNWFNGVWNKNVFPMSYRGWKGRKRGNN